LSGVLTPTPEQQAAIDAFASGATVVIEAGAGTGKTSTLRLLAAARPNARGLYVAYNKAIQVEAKRSFGRNVEARTAHSLAYRNFGAPMRHRLSGPRVTSRRAAAILEAPGGALAGAVELSPSAVASMTLRTVANFCHSPDVAITAAHFARPEAPGSTDLSGLAATAVAVAVAVARRAWTDLISPGGRLKPSHDVYVKLWQLSAPVLAYDFICFDEAQDADRAIAHVVARQDAQLVAVGDSAQAIYAWRGATDFLERLDTATRVALTQSWRFGPAVAEEPNVWLGVLDARLRLRGAPHRDSTVGTLDAPDAILCRSNARCVGEVMAAQDDDRRVALVGGGEDMVGLAEAARRLRAGEPAGHPELVAFADWAEVQDYAEHDPGGSDLAVAVRLIDRHGPEAIIAAVRSCVPEAEAELTISTAHRAKGREWNQVLVAGDFKEPKADPVTGQPGAIRADEVMLAYVTVTRAMTRLDNTGLAWVHTHPAASTPTRGTEAAAGISGPPQAAQRPPGAAVPTEGTEVRIGGLRGEGTVRGTGRDGSVTVVGGPGGQWRSIMPERLTVAPARRGQPRPEPSPPVADPPAVADGVAI